MPFRIDRIRVNRSGPLEKDFDFEPGDLNLIYGRNETGKTYVVESLIRFLFKTKNKATVAADLRNWDVAGKAVVSGLEDGLVSFSKSGDKLEDYWEAGPGLPPNFARLLVVRAGETQLSEAGDGVGRGMLKDYLSGEGLLDRVEDRISRTIQRATVQGHLIDGDRRGELSNLDDRKKSLDDLRTLLEEVEEGYASGDAFSLRQRREALGAQVDRLQKAKRYHAGQLARKAEELRFSRRLLPAEGELATLKLDVTACESNKAELRTKSEEIKNYESTAEDYAWAKQALGEYKEAASGAAGSSTNQIFMLLALASLAGTATFGLLGLTTWLIASVVLSGLFVVLFFVGSTRALSSAGNSAELKNLRATYLDRFGTELTDLAVLQAKVEELNKHQILADPLRESLRLLSDETSALERRTTATLKTWTGSEVPEQEWSNVIQDLIRKIEDIEEGIGSVVRKLSSVGVPDSEYLADDPGEEWEPARYEELSEELRRSDEALRDKEGVLETLKTRVSQATGLDSSDWESLITGLRVKRERASEDYKGLAAEILAKIQVYAVIQELRKHENSRIAEGLSRPELTEPLFALTGRYNSIRLVDEQDLVLVSEDDEEFRLASLSTGAREQVFLALRMGFASIAMEGTPGFIILDDAFQHSDWDRRENLVAQTVGLIEQGWQVFYFTMDDHIRDLFQAAGEKLGDRFRSCELG